MSDTPARVWATQSRWEEHGGTKQSDADPMVRAARIIASQRCYNTVVDGIAIRDLGTPKTVERPSPKQNGVYEIISNHSAHVCGCDDG